MNRLVEPRLAAFVFTACICIVASSGCQGTKAAGVTVQDDAHSPLPWRTLTTEEQAEFELGYSAFNTEWVAANSPAGKIDGLGPIFNAQSCDACHNSRRRGRGSRGDGEVPSDLVIQLGRRLTDGSVQRGSEEYGHILNTSAVEGFTPEARVSIRYDEQVRTLADGTKINLRAPHFRVDRLSGPELSPDTVLMPRLPPPVQGAGLLELVHQSELERVARSEHHAGGSVGGHISWPTHHDGDVIGRCCALRQAVQRGP